MGCMRTPRSQSESGLPDLQVVRLTCEKGLISVTQLVVTLSKVNMGSAAPHTHTHTQAHSVFCR